MWINSLSNQFNSISKTTKVSQEANQMLDEFMDYSPDLVMFMLNKDFIQSESNLKDTYRSTSKDSKNKDADTNLRKCKNVI